MTSKLTRPLSSGWPATASITCLTDASFCLPASRHGQILESAIVQPEWNSLFLREELKRVDGSQMGHSTQYGGSKACILTVYKV